MRYIRALRCFSWVTTIVTIIPKQKSGSGMLISASQSIAYRSVRCGNGEFYR